MAYPDSLRVAEARERYFVENGFERDYGSRWVKLRAGPIPIWFPNTEGRRRAVKLHDLHHVATGYPTTWTGEAEIAAWELASGCGDHLWAWQLNIQAFVIGLVIAPAALWRAFVRGRHAQSLYRADRELHAGLLAERVGELRARLGLAGPPPAPGAWDRLAFAGWSLAAVAYVSWLPALAVYLAVRWLA